ncbi:hypothetical protein A2U01_0086915, partial [Trifolium medium]|nr:hypothetical protein [Trifolium medium]
MCSPSEHFLAHRACKSNDPKVSGWSEEAS